MCGPCEDARKAGWARCATCQAKYDTATAKRAGVQLRDKRKNGS